MKRAVIWILLLAATAVSGVAEAVHHPEGCTERPVSKLIHRP